MARAAAAMSSRCTLVPSRGSVIDGPVPISEVATCAAVACGFALSTLATAPATCGVACDVPDSVTPAEVTSTPGASRDSSGPVCEKQAIWSGTGLKSVQGNQKWSPVTSEYTAPTRIAPDAQAGTDTPETNV